MAKKVFKLSPYLVPKIWGGKKLSQLAGPDETIGEAWYVSLLEQGPSKVEDVPLMDHFQESEIPYLVKILDTSDYLSLQVHPSGSDIERLNLHAEAKGKLEFWIFLNNPERGPFIGLRPGVSRNELEEALKNNQDLSQFLVQHTVKSGDILRINPGILHALGPDCLVLEVQVPIDLTLRVWDWGRVDAQGKSRPLDIDMALESTNFDLEANSIHATLLPENIFQKEILNPVIDAGEYRVEARNLLADMAYSWKTKGSGVAQCIFPLTP